MSLKTYVLFARRGIKNSDLWDAKWLNETVKQLRGNSGVEK